MQYGWNNYGGGPGGWILMLVGMFVFWSIFAFVIVAAVRYFSSGRHHVVTAPGTAAHDSAVEILKTRFAKGEIDEADFKARLALLEGTK
jgi:putative membrane protein